MDEYIRYMWEHPPRCTAKTTSPASSEFLRAAEDELGDYSTVFQIRSAAGESVFPLWTGTDGAVLVGSSTPDQAIFAFNPSHDGYNGEFGLGPTEVRSEERFVCPGCGHDRFTAAAAFQYSGNNEELDEPELVERRQDFFSWFALLACCEKCGWNGTVASVECA
jgi:hypothetical protein